MSDAQPQDRQCPNCSHHITLYDTCHECFGEGSHDLHHEAPFWHPRGARETCGECGGSGTIEWCPECGEDMSKHAVTDHHALQAT